MSQYHIELRTADRVWETIDIESEDTDGLRIELAKFVGELLRDHAAKIWQDRDWRVDVTDGEGLILYSLNLFATDSAATMNARP